jgi:hypothetical protein
MSYGRRPFYIIGTTTGRDAAALVEAVEFFGPAPSLRPDGRSALVLRDEIAQLVAALDERRELKPLVARGRELLAAARAADEAQFRPA